MRALGAARWVLASTSIMALAAIFAPAQASCYYNVPPLTVFPFTPGHNVFALTGDVCSAAGGTYNSPVTLSPPLRRRPLFHTPASPSSPLTAASSIPRAP
jgi:hypothetical protein